jgi:hypothetical protein
MLLSGSGITRHPSGRLRRRLIQGLGGNGRLCQCVTLYSSSHSRSALHVPSFCCHMLPYALPHAHWLSSASVIPPTHVRFVSASWHQTGTSSSGSLSFTLIQFSIVLSSCRLTLRSSGPAKSAGRLPQGLDFGPSIVYVLGKSLE